MKKLDWPAQTPDLNSLNSFEMNWIAKQTCRQTSLMLLCLNRSKALHPCSNIIEKGLPRHTEAVIAAKGGITATAGTTVFYNSIVRCSIQVCFFTGITGIV